MAAHSEPLKNLETWFNDRRPEVTLDPDEWKVVPYEEGHLISPADVTRGSLLYLVVGEFVRPVVPAIERVEDAYRDAEEQDRQNLP